MALETKWRVFIGLGHWWWLPDAIPLYIQPSLWLSDQSYQLDFDMETMMISSAALSTRDELW